MLIMCEYCELSQHMDKLRYACVQTYNETSSVLNPARGFTCITNEIKVQMDGEKGRGWEIVCVLERERARKIIARASNA